MQHATPISLNFEGIRQRYLEKLRAQSGDLDLLQQQVASGATETALGEIAAIAHTLRGAAATLGFQQIHETSEVCERYINDCRQISGNADTSRQMMQAIADFSNAVHLAAKGAGQTAATQE